MMPFRGFWSEFKLPIIGLAPMDGVTDAAFRYMVCKYSRPDVVTTEFTNVEGLARGAVKMLTAFLYSEIERPVCAQIYGVEVESFYKTAVMLCYLGFDGIDINMGCPANKVAKRGSGAGLIKTPELAKTLIRRTKEAVQDWASGISLEEAGVHEGVIKAVKEIRPEGSERREIPVSVKTRIGFDKDQAVEWTKHLLEAEPAAIAMHGRTLKQMYTGKADWEAISRACAVAKASGLDITFLGNGDIESMEDARKKASKYGVDGVLVGRATFGNPWFFSEKVPTIEERIQAAVEHAKYLEENFSDKLDRAYGKIPFYSIRKHLAWYLKGFEGAKKARIKMMQSNSSEDVAEALASLRETC